MVPLTAQVHFSWIEIFFKTTIRLDKKNSESIILGPLFHYAVKSSQLGRRGEYTIKFNVELLLAPILCSSGMNFFGKQFLFYVSFSEQDNCWEQQYDQQNAQWLWFSWQSGCFQHQRAAVRIQLSVDFICPRYRTVLKR